MHRTYSSELRASIPKKFDAFESKNRGTDLVENDYPGKTDQLAILLGFYSTFHSYIVITIWFYFFCHPSTVFSTL
jgi:hypothetical protein